MRRSKYYGLLIAIALTSLESPLNKGGSEGV